MAAAYADLLSPRSFELTTFPNDEGYDELVLARDIPVRSVCDPIATGSFLWRPYMSRHRQNLEWQYHNGGVWPFVGGFWVAALAHAGIADRARRDLNRLLSVRRDDPAAVAG